MGKAAQAALYAQQNPNCLRVAYLYAASALMEKIASSVKHQNAHALLAAAVTTPSTFAHLSSKQRKRALRREKYADKFCKRRRTEESPDDAEPTITKAPLVEESALDRLAHHLANVMTQIRIKTHTPVQPYMQRAVCQRCDQWLMRPVVAGDQPDAKNSTIRLRDNLMEVQCVHCRKTQRLAYNPKLAGGEQQNTTTKQEHAVKHQQQHSAKSQKSLSAKNIENDAQTASETRPRARRKPTFTKLVCTTPTKSPPSSRLKAIVSPVRFSQRIVDKKRRNTT